MKYIDADKLLAEIEKHIKEVKDAAGRLTPNLGFFDAKLSGIYDVVAIIDSLQQEVSDNVDKLKSISTPAEEDWFKISEEWEKEDKKSVTDCNELEKAAKPKVKGYGVMRKMDAPHPVDWYMDESGKEHCWGYKFNEPCPWPAEVYIMEAKESHASDH